MVEQTRSGKIEASLRDSVRLTAEARGHLLGGKALEEVEPTIWEAYSRVEYAIFLIKLETDPEPCSRRAGSKVSERDPGKIVTLVENELGAAVQSSVRSDLIGALSTARTARDHLRSLLVEARKIRKRILLGSPRA